MNEEDVKNKIVVPSIEKSGWDRQLQMSFEYNINSGKINANTGKRGNPQRIDILLKYNNSVNLAVVEVKKESLSHMEGIEQAKEYAKKIQVRFAFSTNGKKFYFFDLKTNEAKELEMSEFPSPNELYKKYYEEDIKQNYYSKLDEINNVDYSDKSKKTPRYYQKLAVQKCVEKVIKGDKRILLVLATGTGKTYIASQIINKLLETKTKRRILFLADRNILVDQTINGDFKIFKNRLVKIDRNNIDTAYEVYLSLYQQLSSTDEVEENNILKENFKQDFFDLIIVDECHRGSAKEDSNWRKILEYFNDATQIGLTATPKENKEVSNFNYFGEPIYTYSLKDGINDGFLAPYKVKRYFIDNDVKGWIPAEGEVDKFGNLIDNRLYDNKDYDKKIVLDSRCNLVANEITKHLKETNPLDKTIVFCVDQEHALRMKEALIQCNKELCKNNENYIVRITSNDEIGKKQIDNFSDPNSLYPVIVTTSELLTTGVDVKTCKNIVFDTNFGDDGMIKFKQMIGRGTRIDEDRNKLFFDILDFRNAVRLLKDKDFDAEPERSEEFTITNDGTKKTRDTKIIDVIDDTEFKGKFYVGDSESNILAKSELEIDENNKLVTKNAAIKNFKNEVAIAITEKYKDYKDFFKFWNNENSKKQIKDEFSKIGISLDDFRKEFDDFENYDDFDLLISIAYGMERKTKKQRVDKVNEKLKSYKIEFQKVINKLLEKYENNLIDDIYSLEWLKTPDIKKEFGGELATIIKNNFGDINRYHEVIKDVASVLYS